MTRTFSLLTVLCIGAFSFSFGCAGPSGMDDRVTAEESSRVGSGYYEVGYQGTTYVVGSAAGAAAVKEGKLPKQTVVRYGEGGHRVLIEADDERDRARLEHEYDRRHVLNKTRF